ncbi:MAG: Gfo/Idh/MocA family oxidoreductase, partial [Paludibacter sp.]|nr:Gfo/Idh/MocA family oxidoreductase [Paludibacter sp.]
MIKGAVIGLGKMGLSHVSILGPQPDVNLVAVCDTSSLVTGCFKKYTTTKTYSDYNKMFDSETLDFVVIALPTKLHYPAAKAALERGIHVFCEKPFVLHNADGEELVRLAREKNLVNQVGYHNHFIGTFRLLKELLAKDALGKIFHFNAEAYGPVVIKPKKDSWRLDSAEGGGCLYDYASHVLNLVQEIISYPVKVHGALVKKIYSLAVEDAVYSLLELENGVSGTLLVNWSDETYRKMSTTLTIQGEKGKIVCDATEMKIYLKEANSALGLDKGWTVKYITDTAIPVNYYLRGEEYSAQIDYFVDCIKNHRQPTINTFEQALYTNKVIDMI